MTNGIAAFAVVSLVLTITPAGQPADPAQVTAVRQAHRYPRSERNRCWLTGLGRRLRRRAGRLGQAAPAPRAQTALDRTAGTALVALGLRVAAEQLIGPGIRNRRLRINNEQRHRRRLVCRRDQTPRQPTTCGMRGINRMMDTARPSTIPARTSVGYWKTIRVTAGSRALFDAHVSWLTGMLGPRDRIRVAILAYETGLLRIGNPAA